jgi:hypothetical protein
MKVKKRKWVVTEMGKAREMYRISVGKTLLK